MSFLLLVGALVFIFWGISRIIGSGKSASSKNQFLRMVSPEERAQLLSRVINDIHYLKTYRSKIPTMELQTVFDRTIALMEETAGRAPAADVITPLIRSFDRLLTNALRNHYAAIELERGMRGIEQSLDDLNRQITAFNKVQEQSYIKSNSATDTRSGKIFKELNTANITDAGAKKLVETGIDHLETIYKQIGIIQNAEVKKKAKAVGATVYVCLQEIAVDPSDVPKAKNFINIYLDSTIKILKKYAELETSAVGSNEQTAVLQKTETILDSLDDGFKKLYAKLKENDVLALEVEMETLKKTLELEN